MNPWLAWIAIWALAGLAMSVGWLWQRRHENAGIVDVLWAAGLAVAGVLLAALGTGAAAPRLALALGAGLWGTRLAVHLGRRVRREPEDGRYQALRQHWRGDQGRFFAFFQFQALLVAVFALPFVAVAGNPKTSVLGLGAGTALWLLAMAGESIADRQLARFRADPSHRGRTCRSGLWRYSRHPNYFFEWVHWLAYPCFALGAPLAWLAWAGPLLMYVFLRWISGVPFTEAQAVRSRGADYRQYQQTTPMLFPWFPKRAPNAPGSPTTRT